MKSKFWHLMVFLALIVSMLPATVAAVPAEPEASPQVAAPEKTPQDMTPQLGAAPKPGAGVESLSGSTVIFDSGVGGDICSIPGATQTFCFNAHSLTNDWEYVYNLWVKFPADWSVTNVYVQGTPSCTGGGSWGTFSWSFQTAPYEVNIYHPRYQAYTDDCTAYYCFEVVSGTGIPNALESWFWDGDGYNNAPHWPCSNDNYTPAGQSACDEAVNPQAAIPTCQLDPGLYLLPPTQEAEGCNGVPQEHTLSLLNNTGADGTFTMSYSVPSANGTLSGPATVFAASGAVVPFDVTLTPDLCAINGDVVIGQVDGAGNGFADSAVINKTIAADPSWEAIPASAPTWAGGGYPRDGCTALNAAGESVTYLFGDTTSIFGFWGYNHDTNSWFQPAPANLPADRWAPDWAYDPATNLCYVTGGANTPGGGTYTEAYRFDPVANSFTALGSFTSMRDFHNSWVGTIDGVKYLCIGGGVNSSSVMIQATQCYDVAQAAPGVWNAENAQMAAFPTDPFGAADGILHAPGGDQFWYVGGAVNGGASISDEARYWDDADNAWHLAGNTGVPRYRVEGDFFNGEFYQLAGSSGGFTPTADAVKGTFDGVGWTWTALPNLNNIRMDNIVAIAENNVWSVDGYGAAAPAYVERLSFCPLCDLQGWLEGTVLDGDTQPVLLGWKPAALAAPEGGWQPGPALDLVTAEAKAAPSAMTGATWSMPEAVLWDNGPLVTHPAACSGQDASRLQTDLSMNTLGFGHQFLVGNRMADDFIITDAGGWQIDAITFFAYQTNAPTNPSPITGVYYQIWNGPPNDPGSSVVFGDLVTNRLVSSTFTNIQRDSGTAPCANNRYIFADVASAGVSLPPGTYWLDWMTDGSLASGPWAPPVTILGQTTTGNGLQYTTSSGAWGPANDSGTLTQQDLPFIIEGTGGPELGPACTNATVTINPGNITVPVDPATGHYGPVMLIQGEYTVEATAPGYSTETATVAIVDELTTVQDFVLYRPVIDVTPMEPISVQTPPSVPVTIPLTISNLGHLPLEWEVFDFGTGAVGTQKGTTRATEAAPDKIEADLTAELDKGPADFFVWLAEKADLSPAAALRTKAEKGEFVFNALKSTAERTQQALRAYLDQKGVTYEPFYIANKILVRGGTEALALDLAGRTDVARLTANHQFQLQEPFVYPLPDHTEAIEGNISFIYAPEVWALGYTGQGTVMAGNDTGLDETHPTIAPHYRGCLNPPTCSSWDHNYNWWDATGTYPNDPYDGHGHGTHTAGTMVGDDGAGNQIGVAPGAQTVHCKNMTDGGSGDDGTFTTCFQWDLAPWDLSGANPNPAMAPDAINNSWGYWGGNAPQFEDEIAALQAAGILVEVSAGNEGPGCGSLRSPGDYEEVLTTGSVDDEGQTFPGIITMGGWSPSRGPSALYPGDYFPDIMAPGQNVRSSLPGNSYGSWGGTSMAGPHATALVGLIWSAAPSLRGQVEETIDIIRESAGPLTGQGGSNCGGDYVTGPNNDWGFGTINALAAVNLALQSADLPWVWEEPISGTIPPMESQVVDVVFHCDYDQAGLVLTGMLRIGHNDPCVDDIDIPLELICGEPTDPDIEVVPPELATIQLPDEQVVQTLNINNLGSLALDWNIIEHNPAQSLAPAAPSAPKAGRPVELKFEAAGGPSVETNPPVVNAPVSLILDDGSRDNDIGLGGTIEMLWVNRFTPAAGEFPFNLNQIQIWFSTVGLVNVGDDIVLIVYENTSGNTDPAVGSNFLGAFPTTVQAVDAWNVYDLATPIAFNGPGDVIIGVIGMETPGTSYWPASMDQTVSQQRSWAGWWNASPPPTPPLLPPENWTLIDAYFPGNWMVRGYGDTGIEPPPECEPVDIPWATVDPTSGTTEGHGTFAVDVTFDSTGMAAGTYTANLCVESNDPDEPFVIVPLEMTVLALQNIEVTPSSLSEELCPDETSVQQLTICNTGDLPLEWTLIEISETVKTSSPFVPVNVKGNGDKAPVTAAAPARPVGKVEPAANPEDVLWDQPLSTVNQGAYVNQDFSDFADYSSFLADDFSNADTWYVDTIFVPGDGWNGFSSLLNADSLTWQIYADDGTGFPDGDPAGGGNPPLWTLTLAPTDPMVVISTGTPGGFPSNTTLNLASPVTVPAGHWWLVFYPTMSFGSFGQFGRQPADTANGYVGKFINPGGGFGYGTIWQDWTVIGPTQPDIAFRIEGSAVPPFDAPWVSEDPTSGTVPGGECTVVDVTFDSTGLAGGDYFTWFLISSNDPDTPEITIPVQLTVLEPAAIAGVTYTVNGLEVTFDATATGAAPLTFAWDFGDSYTSALEDPVHVYAATGCYQVTLTVSNGCGEDTWAEQICVTQPYYYYYLPIVMGYYPAP